MKTLKKKILAGVERLPLEESLCLNDRFLNLNTFSGVKPALLLLKVVMLCSPFCWWTWVPFLLTTLNPDISFLVFGYNRFSYVFSHQTQLMTHKGILHIWKTFLFWPCAHSLMWLSAGDWNWCPVVITHNFLVFCHVVPHLKLPN